MKALLLRKRHKWHLSLPKGREAMPVDAHSRQGAPSLLATRYGSPITIRAKEGLPKANQKARPTQRSPCTVNSSHQRCMALALTARGDMHVVLGLTLFLFPPYNRVNFHGKLLVYDHTTGKTPVLVRSPKLSPVGRG